MVRIIALALEVLVFILGQWWRRRVLRQGAAGPASVRARCIQWVVDLGGDHRAHHGEQEQRQDAKSHGGSPQATLINSMRMAHFL
ncbi:hypothetical protein D3C81_2105960 [compost metagenome]